MRRLRRDDAGVTLIELLVTMLVLSICTTIIVTLFANITTTLTRDGAATDSTNVAAIGMNEVTRVIRAGTEYPKYQQTLNDPVFVTAGREEIELYAYLDTDSITPKPVKVRFFLNGSRELQETRWPAVASANPSYWNFSPTPTSTRTIARLISPYAPADPDAKYLFTYFKADGTVIPVTANITDPALLRQIAAVQVTMKVQADITGRAAPVTLRNTVGIPNLGISRVGP